MKAYAYNELRYSSLAITRPDRRGRRCSPWRRPRVTEKYRQYEELASRDGSRFHPVCAASAGAARPRTRDLTRRSQACPLTTTYLGLTLKSPLVASASPLSATSAISAVLRMPVPPRSCLPSLFQEQIEA